MAVSGTQSQAGRLRQAQAGRKRQAKAGPNTNAYAGQGRQAQAVECIETKLFLKFDCVYRAKGAIGGTEHG